MADHQISPGMTHSPSRLCLSDLRRSFRARTGLCIYWPAHPAAPPLSASCSSGQRFAYSFLQIPPRDGHPCRSANTSPCRVCRGLSPPSECALPGAPVGSPAFQRGVGIKLDPECHRPDRPAKPRVAHSAFLWPEPALGEVEGWGFWSQLPMSSRSGYARLFFTTHNRPLTPSVYHTPP